MASPAEIVRACLVNKGLVVRAPTPGLVVCYVSSMPDEDDQAVCVYDTAGLHSGRRMDGPQLIHLGVKILIRALDYSGWMLANQIAVGLDTTASRSTIVVDGIPHYVQSVYRTSPVISLGEEVGKKRQLWSINARVALQDSEPPLG